MVGWGEKLSGYQKKRNFARITNDENISQYKIKNSISILQFQRPLLLDV